MNRMANNVDPDEMAHYEPSHLDLHCLQRYLSWSAGPKRLWHDTFCSKSYLNTLLFFQNFNKKSTGVVAPVSAYQYYNQVQPYKTRYNTC